MHPRMILGSDHSTDPTARPWTWMPRAAGRHMTPQVPAWRHLARHERAPLRASLNRAGQSHARVYLKTAAQRSSTQALRPKAPSRLAQRLTPHKTRYMASLRGRGALPLGWEPWKELTQNPELSTFGELHLRWVLPSQTHGQILSAARSSPRGGGSVFYQSALGPASPLPAPGAAVSSQWLDWGLWAPSATASRRGEAQLGQTVQYQIPPGKSLWMPVLPFPGLLSCPAWRPLPKVPPAQHRGPGESSASREGLLSAHPTVLYHWEETKRKENFLISPPYGPNWTLKGKSSS